MTDLDITKLCAEAMYGKHVDWEHSAIIYNPLHDDAQAMALVKKFGLSVQPLTYHPEVHWIVRCMHGEGEVATKPHAGNTTNRAICECVAKMQKAKAWTRNEPNRTP